MIASHIYVQVRDWFKQMIIPESDRSQEDKDWLNNFKFNLQSNAYRGTRRDFSDRDRGGGKEQRRYDDRNNRNEKESPYNRNGNRGRRAHWKDERSHTRDASPNEDDLDEFRHWQEDRAQTLRRGRHDDDSRGYKDQGDDRDAKRRRASMFRG